MTRCRGSGSCVSMGMKQPFEKVVEQHGGTVLRVCRVLLGVHDAEVAWSETFLRRCGLPDLPDDANAEAWLVTIAHRKAIDVLRARKRQPAPVGDIPRRRPRSACRAPRRRPVAGGRGAAGEAAPGGGVSLCRRPGVRRDR